MNKLHSFVLQWQLNLICSPLTNSLLDVARLHAVSLVMYLKWNSLKCGIVKVDLVLAFDFISSDDGH